jgi:hypothetical protein
MIIAKFASSIVFTVCLIGLSVCAPIASTTPARASEAEETIWKLEHSYWHYVETNDLSAYRNLWRDDFLGWPSVSAVPLHKDHITDWITSQTVTGHTFKLIAFKSAAIQASDTTVVVCYWTTYKWIDNAGQGEERKVRVTHTWIKNDNVWQIIGGMSMPEITPAQK